MPLEERATAGNDAAVPTEGRDELNIAEFPISSLQRQGGGVRKKTDTLIFRSSRYDPIRRQRVPQTVTIVAPARFGLPTPADEHVLLGLLHLAKMTTNFANEEVRFIPHQLFQIMHWSANSRSYERLRGVLRRLKSLTILYQNAWWDANDRHFEEEFATNLIAEYRLVQEGRGRKKGGELASSWVRWTSSFFQSLAHGNLKRLDLSRLFSLRFPTSQRLYRFLDKRFFSASQVELDLRDLACGHVGLAYTHNVAVLKRNLRPAIAELEDIGFIEKAPPKERYTKLSKGQWRIVFVRKGDATSRPVLEKELLARGIRSATASALVTSYPPERIRKHLAVFDWMRQNRDPHVFKNPAGFLVKAIQQDYQPPNDFVAPPPKRGGERKEYGGVARLPRRTEAASDRPEILEYWNSLTPPEQQRIEQEALSGLKGVAADDVRGNLDGPLAKAIRQHAVEEEVRKILREKKEKKS